MYITKVTICMKGREVESQSGNSAAICTSHHWPEFSASLNSFRSSGPNLCGCLSAYLCPMSYCHFCPVLYSRRFLLTFNCSCSTSVIILKVFPFPVISEGPQRLLHGSQNFVLWVSIWHLPHSAKTPWQLLLELQ